MMDNPAVLWHKMLLLLTVTAVNSFSEGSTENTFYVTPTPDTPCPGEPCHTLSQYTDQYRWNFSSNTTVVFLPGDHTLNRTISMGAVSIDYPDQLNKVSPEYYYLHPSLTLLGSSSSLPEVTSRIVCTWPAGFAFLGITELVINALAFISCGHSDSAAVKIESVWNISISNCLFQDNTNGLPQQKSTTGGCGGAIYVYNSTLTLVGNTIQNNSADLGGALYAYTKNTLTLMDNKFRNNSAGNGGALIANIDNILTLSDNTFQNNSANNAGGAICINTSNILTLLENTLLNNSADYGGVFYADTNNTLTFSVNTFHNNSADFGGALAAQTNNTITLSENTFQSNSADYGGALLVHISNTLTLSENTLLNNSAEYGGALYADTNNTLTLSENTFQNSSADYGGALAAQTNNTLALSENTFQNNSADYGGALLVHTNNTLTLSQNKLLYNSADYGGALYVGTNNTLTLSENTFQDNSADYGGALYTDTNNTLTLSKTKFHNNSAEFGGALATQTDNTFTLSENTFQNNSADYGGALYADTNNTLTLSAENTFQNNSSGDGGALVANTDNILSLSDNTFQNNSANNAGGAIYINTNNTLTLLENTLLNNSAHYGGVLYAGTNNTITFSVNTFHNNSAEFGGALAAQTSNTLTLSENTFQSNSAEYGGALLAHTSNTLTLSENKLLDNSADYGGALYADTNNTLTLSENTFQNNSADYGGALFAGGVLHVHQSTIHFIENVFTRNTAKSGGGAIFCINNSTLSMRGSHRLQNNTARYGGGIALLECQIKLAGDLLFENNRADFGGGLYTAQSQVSGYAKISNNVANIDGGGIYASRSTFHFKQCITFVGNSALNGGGLLLTEGSTLYLQPNTMVNFTNNSAKYKGGAIKVEKNDPLIYCVKVSCGDCFFQIQTQGQYNTGSDVFSKQHNIRMYFQNDTALEAGGAVYGGSIDNCNLGIINPPPQKYLRLNSARCPNSGEFFDYISSSDEQSLDISSDPLYICTCEGGEPDCSISSIMRFVYPGGTIKVPIIAYGQRNGTTPAVIHNITPKNKIEIDNPENTQSITNSCTFLNYTVRTHAIGTVQEMTLYADGSCSPKERTVSSLPTNIVKVHVSILQCPPGFELLSTQSVCTCAQRLERFTNSCRIEDRKIERNTQFWVGYIRDNTSDGLILHPHCPFDYCTSNKMYIAVNASDEQCSSNRTGLLCGKCAQNFSLVLGTNRCLKCSNYYLWLTVAFAFAGVALVLLLLVLRLTVAVGTINGLVFYANILAVNSATFFRPQSTNILTVFIAWLNLDLGIEGCFYNGMDAYTKAWLQFAFPLYVWALVGVIILVSHHSSKVSTLLGTNPIAVLATLFLISYAKFLRTVIAALSYTLLEYPNNSQTAVWLYDGNIRYLGNRHIPLFITALLCLVVLFLPYTLFLIFSQWLRSKSGEWKVISWANHRRVLPFLDAYHAPYTDKHRYWTGLMLLVRCILFLLFAFNTLGDPSVDLLAIGSITAVLLIVYALFGNRIYKTWYLNVLELSFIANLSILALATLYIRSAGGNQNAVTFTSVSTAFATFIGIVTYHSVQQISQLWRRIFPQNIDNYELVTQTNEDSNLEGIAPPSPPDGCVTVTHINIHELLAQDDNNELREPCIA